MESWSSQLLTILLKIYCGFCASSPYFPKITQTSCSKLVFCSDEFLRCVYISLLRLPSWSTADWVVKTMKIYFPSVLEPKHPRPRCLLGWFVQRCLPGLWMVFPSLCLFVVFTPCVPVSWSPLLIIIPGLLE